LLEEAEKKVFYARKLKIFENVSRKEIVIFSRQLAILFKSEVPLVESLQSLALQAKDPFKGKLMNIAEEIQGGSSFSQALSKYPKVFTVFYVSMVKSGEAAGKMSETLLYLADHLEREYQVQSKLKGAMIYPAFIMGTLFLVGMVMIYFVIPQLTSMLTDFGGKLPLLTRMIIGFSDFFRSKGYWLLPILVLLIIFGKRYISTPEGKRAFDNFALKIPIFGKFIMLTNIVQFSENLSTLISGGLPITRALEITKEVLGNIMFKEMVTEISEAVRKGETISSVLERHPEIVPPLVLQMTLVGERTGQVDNALKNIVVFYQKELDASVDNMISLIEPILLVFLGVVVGILVAGIMLPIYNMGSGTGTEMTE